MLQEKQDKEANVGQQVGPRKPFLQTT